MIDRPRIARVGTALLLLGSVAVVMIGTDLPRSTGELGTPSTRAALAWRDREIPFFQWGTHVYTEPLLAAHYAEVRYLTGRSRAGVRHVIAALHDLLARYQTVDVFLAVHGGARVLAAMGQIPEALKHRLRLVYSTGCGDAHQGWRWTVQGAETFVGHDGQRSLSPFFYVYFLRRWTEGRTAAEAVALANLQMGRRLGLAPDPGFDLVRETRARVIGQPQTRIDR